MGSDWDELINPLFRRISDDSSFGGRIWPPPQNLEKSNELAYMPRVVSIGPRFNGSREELLLMENTKLKCLQHLFSRVTLDYHHQILHKCREIIFNFEDRVRDSYLIPINMEQHELAKTMLIDSCFLLELVISKELDGIVDSYSYIKMVDDIKRLWRRMLNSLVYRQEWIVKFMNRGYNFVATMLFVLTLLQTVYTILGYYIPK